MEAELVSRSFLNRERWHLGDRKAATFNAGVKSPCLLKVATHVYRMNKGLHGHLLGPDAGSRPVTGDPHCLLSPMGGSRWHCQFLSPPCCGSPTAGFV
jgi:hypothetical protein